MFADKISFIRKTLQLDFKNTFSINTIFNLLVRMCHDIFECICLFKKKKAVHKRQRTVYEKDSLLRLFIGFLSSKNYRVAN